MKKPKMIMFDQGGTLFHESNWSAEKGYRELFKYVTFNPYGYTLEDVLAAANEIFDESFSEIKEMGYDFRGQNLNKALFESLGMELSLTYLEQETVFWDACTDVKLTEGIDKALDVLEEMGIRTAVISNIGWDTVTLKKHIEKYLPNNKFEFYIASSEYVFRKPSRFIYEIAIKKSKLKPDEIWYCGDNITADVVGSYNAGMYPVWYDCGKPEAYVKNNGVPDCEHLRIGKWSELIDNLKALG